MIATLFALVTLLVAPRDGDHLRIRTTDLRTASMIDYGLERSVIFRGLIAEIESGDVIVHVRQENFLPGRLGGRLHLIGRAGARRYVRITLDAELQPRQFVASLAHELQHVSELIAHPGVEDERSLAELYRRIGREYRVSGQVAFETEAARRVGVDVLKEMLTPRHTHRQVTTTLFASGARDR